MGEGAGPGDLVVTDLDTQSTSDNGRLVAILAQEPGNGQARIALTLHTLEQAHNWRLGRRCSRNRQALISSMSKLKSFPATIPIFEPPAAIAGRWRGDSNSA